MRSPWSSCFYFVFAFLKKYRKNTDQRTPPECIFYGKNTDDEALCPENSQGVEE